MPPGIRPARPGQLVTFILIPVIGETKTFERIKRSEDRWHHWLSENVREFFDEPHEHVAVLYEGERRDMFVGETSSTNGRHIRNVRATAIYRANAIAQYKKGNSFDLPDEGSHKLHALDPERFPAISGPAVLFPDTFVWR